MKLDHISIDKIVPNENNPRGIDIETQDTKLSYLKDSIRQFGVLVPLVVTPKGKHFLLVDGERRYHAARSVGLSKLPAYIIESADGGKLTDKELLFRMFQIHHLREQWGPVQQCNALEKAFTQIAARKNIESIEDQRAWTKAVAEQLAEATGIDERTALDRVKFLRWPKSIKQMLYEKPDDPGYWYICEIEEKIIIPAQNNYPEYFKKVDVNEVRTDLFKKLNDSLTRSTEVRRVAPYFRIELKKPADKKRVHRILERLHTQPDMTYEEAQHEFEKQFPDVLKRDPPSPRKLLRLLSSLDTELELFDVNAISKAQHRAKATPTELLEVANSLHEDLAELISELKGLKRER